MTTDEVLDDFRNRLQAADKILSEMASNNSGDFAESCRLLGKAEGVRLALDYLRAYDA